MPLSLSVIIPTYNDAEYLAEAVSSVLNQQYSGELEILIVDDGSEPPAATIYQPNDPRVRVHRQARRGVSAARNAGIELSRGDFVAFLDADDLMLPGRLERQIALLDAHPEVGLVGGDITRRDPDGREDSWGIFEAFGEEIPAESAGEGAWVFAKGFREQVLRHYPFNASVMTARRAALDEGVRFDPELICWEDWDFVARLARRRRVGYCRVPVALYRKRAGSITTTPDPRKFASRARMFGKWRREFEDLDAEATRALERAENDAWLAASYEFRRVNRVRAAQYAFRAFVAMPRWKSLKSLAAAAIGRAGG